ncbi:unnamed protein product [Lymnaea stagnalis]|uniref:Uncharacterized protein n=1 Tax=Lymnaea stagnalis TaxID=6523 RepID=A0AAV2GY01_LYMST
MNPAVLLVASLVCLWTFSSAQEDLTPKERNILSVLNGYFTNTEQIFSEIANKSEFIHPLSGLLFIPVKVPALDDKPTGFFEQRHEDKVFRRFVTSVSENDRGQIIVEVFDLPFSEDDTPGTYNLENLNSFQPGDLTSRPECSAVLTEVSENYFTGHWPDCTQEFPGERPYYDMTFSCTKITAVTHLAARESPGGSPFILRLEIENCMTLFLSFYIFKFLLIYKLFSSIVFKRQNFVS